MKNKKAFTLVELLVVIAIISVLASMLLPALQNARQQAYTLACANTMRQAGQMVHLFVDDYDGYLPCSTFQEKTAAYQKVLFPPAAELTSANYSWCHDRGANNFTPYWQPLERAMCPAHPRRTEWLEMAGSSWQTATTYLMSGHKMSRWSSNQKSKVKLIRHRSPAKLFMWLEREDYEGKGANDFNDSTFQKAWGTYQLKAMGYHHNGYKGFNACFYDGHIRFYHFNRQPLSSTEGELEADNWE